MFVFVASKLSLSFCLSLDQLNHGCDKSFFDALRVIRSMILSMLFGAFDFHCRVKGQAHDEVVEGLSNSPIPGHGTAVVPGILVLINHRDQLTSPTR